MKPKNAFMEVCFFMSGLTAFIAQANQAIWRPSYDFTFWLHCVWALLGTIVVGRSVAIASKKLWDAGRFAVSYLIQRANGGALVG